MSFISTATLQFPYFDHQLGHPDWRGKKVLDFGGNVGNILRDPKCTIDHDHYWSLDVSRDAIEEGKRRHPAANFVFYDRYNFSFNPTGIRDLPIPDLGERFDYILSYSIFSHTGKKELVDTMAELRKFLAPDGKLIFTYLDPDFNASTEHPGYLDMTNFEKRVRRLNDGVLRPELMAQNRDADWSILLNRDDLYIEQDDHQPYNLADQDTYFSFFRTAYIHTLFPTAITLPPPAFPYPPDYPAEMQHACILRSLKV